MNLPPSPDNPLWSPIPASSEPCEELLGLLDEARMSLAASLAEHEGDCRACGSCCDFRHYDHILFATKLELDAALMWSRRHLRLTVESAGQALRNNLCPFWRNGRCDIHASRPLGCRAHFCNLVRKKVALPEVEQSIQQYRTKLVGHMEFAWYGPALAYWQTNVTAFSAQV